jgi:hypothetical protein
VLLQDAVGHREPQAGTAADALGRVERVVDALDVLAPDAVAGVLHLDDHGVLVGARHQREPAAARHRVARVQDQVEEDLLDPVLVAADLRQLRRQLLAHLDPGLLELVLHQREHVEHGLVQVERLHLGAARAREVEQVVDDLGRAEGLLLDLLEQHAARVSRRHLAAQHLGVGRDARQRRVDLVRHPRGEQADRGHLLRVLELLLEPDARRDVVEDQDRALALARAHLERRDRDVDHHAAPVGGRQVQLVDVRDLVVARRAQHQAAAQRLEEGAGEDLVERAAQHVLAPASAERLERAVPARDQALEVEHQDPRVHALEDVLVVLGQLLELVGLLAQALVEAAVHERRRRLRRQRLDQLDLLAVEDVEALLAPDAQHRDQLVLAAAGEVVRQVQRARLGHRLGRGLGVDGLAARQLRDQLAARGEPHALRPRGAAEGLEDRERAGALGQEHRHRLDAERRRHAVEQPLRHPRQVEVGVEVLRQPQQRAPRVVALAEEQPVDALLHAALDRREQQDHDERREHGDQRGVRLVVGRQQRVEQVDGQQADADDERRRQRVDERAPEDQLDVHQPVLDHRVGQRERDQRQRDVAGQLHRQARLAAERERDRVEQEERQHPGAGAPDQPLHLLARRQAARLAVRVEQDRERDREQRREVERLPAVDRRRDLPQHLAARGAQEQHLAGDRGARQRERRQVGRGDDPRPMARDAALGERQAEVQEHDGQEQDGEVVGPEQRPVAEVELARERGRVHQEEQQADGVEVQRRAVGRPPQHHDRADDEAEEADEREVVEESDVALRERPDRHLERAALLGAQQRVAEARPRQPPLQPALELLGREDLLALHGEQHVAHAHARLRGRPVRRHARGDKALRREPPEHAVVELAPGGFQEDVVDAEREQDQGHEQHGQVLDRQAGHLFEATGQRFT